MSISGVGNNGQAQYSPTQKNLTDYLSEGFLPDSNSNSGVTKGITQRLHEKTQPLAGKKKGNAAYANATSEKAGTAALKRALKELSGEVNGTVTFATISAYRQSLEQEFSMKARIELFELGIDLEKDFTLHLSPEGTIQIECDDPVSKELIQQYMGKNSEMCDQFSYIQALSNLDRVRQNNAGTALAKGIQETRSGFQSELVEQFFSDGMSTNTNFAGMIAQFRANEEEVTFYTGLDFSV